MIQSRRDRLLATLGGALLALSGAAPPVRAAPSGEPDAEFFTLEDRRLASGLMRVNHSGEVCAQALYAGQALVSRDMNVRRALERAGEEERDHLAWCRQRLEELDSRPSVLDPFWYAGSLVLGVASGLAGDRWSLGFLVETERQVEHHLDDHLNRLPLEDRRSRAILEQMRKDEIAHGRSGEALGAEELPRPVKLGMKLMSRLMTRMAFWI